MGTTSPNHNGMDDTSVIIIIIIIGIFNVTLLRRFIVSFSVFGTRCTSSCIVMHQRVGMRKRIS